MTEFEKRFGALPEAQAQASGRVNLIGEHTDYNGGFVLPAGLPQKTTAWIRKRSDGRVRIASSGFKESFAEFEIGEETPTKDWSSYIKGVTHVLSELGRSISGFDLYVSSDVPMGSGLSSSAALEVSVFRAIRKAFALENFDDISIARASQRVENEFVGARVGIMDPMAASLADERTALFLDTRDLTFERIPLPLQVMELFVINSGVSHSNVHGGGYNERRAECEEACARLGVKELRDLEISDISKIDSLPDPYRRRARHVIMENKRVKEAVEALKRHDIETLGRLFQASHESMRDDFEVSIPEIETLVKLAKEQPGVYGARLTGGGFGGSIVGIAEPGRARAAAEQAAYAYQIATGNVATILMPIQDKDVSGSKTRAELDRSSGPDVIR